MPTVNATTLTFFRAWPVKRTPPESQTVSVFTNDSHAFIISISLPADSPFKSTFQSTRLPPRFPAGGSGGLVSPVPPSVEIPISFNPLDSARVTGTLTIDALNPETGFRPAGFPASVMLIGNEAGVGPGALKIMDILADPIGDDLPAEFIEIANVSDIPLDITGCTLHDLTFSVGPTSGRVLAGGTERLLHRFNGLTDHIGILDPIAAGGQRLRVFTGAGPMPPDPSFKTIALGRSAPVWNNTGDTGRIRNPHGHLVDSFKYVVRQPAPAPDVHVEQPPAKHRLPTQTLNLAADTDWHGTGLMIEDGDVLNFSATGSIQVAHGWVQGSSGPAGRVLELALADWPLPGLPIYGLIGRIGTDGPPFFIGARSSRTIAGQNGELFLGVNDVQAWDNWGEGYACAVSVFR